MLIAIASDSHDQIPNLQRAVRRANQEDAQLLIHCGDLISPFMLNQLHAFQGDVHLIYGNNAGDRHLIATRCAATAGMHHHGCHGTLTAGSLRIALQHYPEPARDLARSGAFDVVCCGHDHTYAVERINGCLLINPGDLLGKDALPAFALLDTTDFSVRRVVVGDRLILDD